MERTIFQKIGHFLFPAYDISAESFIEQFQGIDKAELREVKIVNPGAEHRPMGTLRCMVNPIRKIHAIDHNTHRITLDAAPKWEVRLILKNGKSKTFFFDSVYLEDGFFHGSNSRIMNLRAKVPAAELERVRIRNNRKRHIYKD